MSLPRGRQLIDAPSESASRRSRTRRTASNVAGTNPPQLCMTTVM